MTWERQRGGQGTRRATSRAQVTPSDFAADRARAFALTPVSRETAERLERFVALLLDWQQRMNLIASSTEPIIWTRHIADSLQLLDLAPQARIWADLGSGAGFPGLVIACALAGTPGARVHLVESSTKKAAFLAEAVRAIDAPADVHALRISDFVARPPAGIEVVTARALAPLTGLLDAAYPLLKTGARGLFPKGQYVDAELTEAARCWSIEAAVVPSRTDPAGRIVCVNAIQPVIQPKRVRPPSAR